MKNINLDSLILRVVLAACLLLAVASSIIFGSVHETWTIGFGIAAIVFGAGFAGVTAKMLKY